MTSRTAFKFLRPGKIGPFSGFAWPPPEGGGPGEWVSAATGLGACRSGIHACEPPHLMRWIWEELWVIELAGEIEARRHKLRAERGRLLRQVDEWSPQTAKSFATACAERAAQHASDASSEDRMNAIGMAQDGGIRAQTAVASSSPYVAAHGGAVSAYISAMTALRVGGPERHEAERAWQARWLATALDLH